MLDELERIQIDNYMAHEQNENTVKDRDYKKN